MIQYTDMKSPSQITLVIFGISGDLSRRKILPAAIRLFASGKLPEKFRLIGVTRQAISIDDIFNRLIDVPDKALVEKFKEKCEIFQADLSKNEEFIRLSERLEEIDDNDRESARLFYLSVPPDSLGSLIDNLGTTKTTGLIYKLIFEKPFGENGRSAESVFKKTNEYFTEEEIYRADHYMAKSMVQNIFNWKKKYEGFEALFSNEYIERIEVTSLESIGIEGRANFFDKTGAIRDLTQSHLLEVLAQTMRGKDESRQEILQSLLPINEDEFNRYAIRGQYDGYRTEVGNETSMTETFAELTFFSQDSRWLNIPLTLVTGKALDCKKSEIILYLKENNGERGHISFHIQPDIEIDFSSLPESLQGVLGTIKKDLSGQEQVTPEGYELILLEVFAGSKELFLNKDEIRELWRLIDPIMARFAVESQDLLIYDKGSSLLEIRKKYEHTKDK
jgi:glucose-6-phosphate 1-dehydrogenase